MEHIMSGIPVASAILDKTAESVKELRAAGIDPKLAILRVGEKPGDIRYESNLMRKGESIGILTESRVLPSDSGEGAIRAAIREMNEDRSVHGILLLRPLPAGTGEDVICAEIDPEKDVDGASPVSLAGVFTGRNLGFSPCTARAVMEMIDYYGAEPEGKKVTMLGRSLVVGRPLAMLLLSKNATVTLCHSRSINVQEEAKQADILITAVGKANLVDRSYVRKGQLVFDVGVSPDPLSGKLCGDVDFDEVEPLAEAITPMKGGIGAVTTAVLLTQTAEAAFRCLRKPSRTE